MLSATSNTAFNWRSVLTESHGEILLHLEFSFVGVLCNVRDLPAV